ncbi:dipeptide epimerase [Pedobacter puniceum]|uniref:Dipeptide epimerase n=1 Tax=Pedobacter puniceum TaxID=2666136 RepID=A0A7K0FRQ0_9SPHI|nr:dipeptide epimerase [Pedobacter puniceum]MRX47767.1 dipeptide epimerase [Pedobacter puniceum]
MKISYKSFNLLLKFPFTIAKFSRTSTPIMLVEIFHEGYTGIGEASMVPYMGENEETASSFLSKLDLSKFTYPFDFAAIHQYMDDITAGMPAIKAAIDIALYDLAGKIAQKPCYNFFDSVPQNMPETTYTIGIDEPEMIIKKVEDALKYDFKILKVKLGRENDKQIIQTIRNITHLPLFVDANQGWADKNEGLDMAFWLKEQGVVLIEQPMPKENIDGNAWITSHSPIPIIGDEAVQRLADVSKAKGVYHGINIKLMKSAGLYEAYEMIKMARVNDLKILIGCMSETSVATLAGVALAPLCDWADLDGPFMTTNNPFKTPDFIDGKYILSDEPGLGLKNRD